MSSHREEILIFQRLYVDVRSGDYSSGQVKFMKPGETKAASLLSSKTGYSRKEIWMRTGRLVSGQASTNTEEL